MTDTRNVIHRTEKCLECHLGTKEKFVDHEMIAAGHPDLYFELDSFSAVMPRHWKVPRESAAGKAGRRSCVGRSARLGDGTSRATTRIDGAPGLARQRASAPTKKMPGPSMPSFPASPATTRSVPPKIAGARNTATKAVAPAICLGTLLVTSFFAIFAKQIDSAYAQELDRQMLDRLHRNEQTQSRSHRRREGRQRPPLPWLNTLLIACPRCNTIRPSRCACSSASPTTPKTSRISDERAAEQAAMAMDSLYIAYSKDTKPANAAEIRAAINALFQQLENPSSYNADQFAASLHRLRPMFH